MFYLIHLIFIVIKILLLSITYAIIVLLFMKLIFKQNINFKKWIFTSFSIFILLFFYSQSHWGNHGLGDFSRIPLKYNKEIIQIDNSTIIETKNTIFHIDSFYFTNNLLFAKNENQFIIWNLENDEIINFNSTTEFYNELDNREIEKHDLADFKTHYAKYWNNYKFWLLP